MGAVSAISPPKFPPICIPPPILSHNFRPLRPIGNPRRPRVSVVFAESNGGGEVKEERRPAAATVNFWWRDLLDPNPENLVAVALTGLLTWASVQVLWQLFYISIAILLAALKYSFIAALLLFILITLL